MNNQDKKVEENIKLENDFTINEASLRVEDQPFKAFDRLNFFKQNNISYLSDEESNIKGLMKN